MAAERHPATVEQLKALAHPVRLRILRLCLDRARTNQELATRLHMAPGSVLRHVRQLTRAGLLAAEEPRPGRHGTPERPYRATGLSWRMSLDAADTELSHRAELAIVDAYRAELADAAPDAWVEGARTPLWLTPEQRQDLVRRMATVIEDYRDTHHESADRYSILWSMHAEPDEGPADGDHGP